MTDIEQLLADVADYFQARIREDRVLRHQLRQAMKDGVRPDYTRQLGPELPGERVIIMVSQLP